MMNEMKDLKYSNSYKTDRYNRKNRNRLKSGGIQFYKMHPKAKNHAKHRRAKKRRIEKNVEIQKRI